MDTYQGRIREPQSLHKYLYVHGDPANLVDPSGQFISIGGLMKGVAVGAIITISADVSFGLFQNATHNNGMYYHDYTTDQITICTKQEISWCNKKEVWAWMRRMPAPRYLSTAYLSDPLEDGDPTCCIGGPLPWLLGGKISVEVDQYYVNNVTESLHTLAYGRVDREVMDMGHAIKIRTRGHGRNRLAFFAWLNDRVGPDTFNSHDETIRRHLLNGPMVTP